MHNLETSAFVDNENVAGRISQHMLNNFHAYRMFVSLHIFMAFLRKVNNSFSHLLFCLSYTFCSRVSLHIRCASNLLHGLGMFTRTSQVGLKFIYPLTSLES